MANQTLYVVTSTQDISTIYRNTASLDFVDFPRNVLMALGASESAIDKWESKVHDPNVISLIPEDNKGIGEILFRQQLLPGSEFETVQKVFMGSIHESLRWDNISSNAILPMTQNTRKISLLKWTRQVLLDSATRTFFGDALLKIEPDLSQIFCEFDDDSWQLHYKYPRFLSKRMHTARDRIASALVMYFRLPKEHRQNEAWITRSLEFEMRRRDIDDRDIAVLSQS